MLLVEARGISKTFNSSLSSNNSLHVLDNFSLSVNKGELITLFGPNGCGKSTILNILAGISAPDTGEIYWNSDAFDSRNVGYVFQNYGDTLLPWRTVRDNVAFPLHVRGLIAADINKKTADVISLFHLEEHSNKFIYELSGGLKQLVAIARSITYNPCLLLLDEPFSALDYSTSRMLWTRFREFWADMNVTTIFVSHNIDEAVFLGDRVCVLSPRPTRIVTEISVPFGRVRELDILRSEKFFEVRTRVLNAFEEGRKR